MHATNHQPRPDPTTDHAPAPDASANLQRFRSIERSVLLPLAAVFVVVAAAGSLASFWVHASLAGSGSPTGSLDYALQLGVIYLAGLVVFGLVAVAIIRRRVTGRLVALAHGIAGNGAHDGLAGFRGPLVDEITMLASTIAAAQANAQSSLEQVERLALVARCTTNAVVITDVERRVVWVNEGFTRMTGFTLAECVGRSPGALLQCEGTDPEVVARMRKALEANEPCRVDILNRAKDGREYWLDLEIQPVRDGSGALTGFISIESDITAAVQARRELEVSERRQKLIVAGAELGTWDWHIPSGEVQFNARWCEMAGYRIEEIEAHVRSWERIVHPEDMQMASAALQEHFDGRSDLYRCEHRLRAKDGSVVWVLDSGKVYERDAEGRPVRMAGIHLDITERRRAEARFELAVKGSSAGIWDWDVRTNKNFMSARFKEMLGYPPDHPMDSYDGWADLLHPEDRGRVLDALWAHVRTGSPYSIDYRLKHRSGEWRWYHAHGQAEWDSDGNPVRMAGSLEDIHEKRTIESARARLAAIVEHSEDAILGLTLAGEVLTCNAAAMRIFGYGAESLLGASELHLVPEEERVAEERALARIARGERVEQYEARRLRADGRVLEVSVTLSAVRDESGAVVGAAKIVRDITERREKRELQELNALLARQNRKLEDMTERAHRFVDDVSHEFRTPLTVIREYSSIIADGLGGPVTRQQSDWLQIVDIAAVDLNQMVEDFLDSSKLRAGRLRVDRRACTAESILDGVRKLIARKAASRSIRVVQHVDPGLPPAFADEEKVRRIVMNLVTNAIKFSPDAGTVVLSAVLLPSGDIEFSVADQGPGLAPEDMRQLFERFRQLPNALAPSVKGFGLGLNIARQLVWLNLGTISVASEKGKGAVFGFTLPTHRMEVVVDRFFERLAERDEPPARIGMLRVTPARGGATVDELRRLAVAGTRPADIVVPAGDGRSLVLFGPTGSIETWRMRIVDGLRRLGGGDPLGPQVTAVGSWEYPVQNPAAREAIRAAILREHTHASVS